MYFLRWCARVYARVGKGVRVWVRVCACVHEHTYEKGIPSQNKRYFMRHFMRTPQTLDYEIMTSPLVARSCQLMSSYQQQQIPGGCSPDPSVQCTVPGQPQPGLPQPGLPQRPGLPQPGQQHQPGQQPQPGQPGRRDLPLPGRVEFPRPGRAMGLPPSNGAAQANVDGAPAQIVTGSGGCVPDCANGGTCSNGTCVCRPGVTGDACQTGAWL